VEVQGLRPVRCLHWVVVRWQNNYTDYKVRTKSKVSYLSRTSTWHDGEVSSSHHATSLSTVMIAQHWACPLHRDISNKLTRLTTVYTDKRIGRIPCTTMFPTNSLDWPLFTPTNLPLPRSYKHNQHLIAVRRTCKALFYRFWWKCEMRSSPNRVPFQHCRQQIDPARCSFAATSTIVT
jgi:hypothetical protein